MKMLLSITFTVLFFLVGCNRVTDPGNDPPVQIPEYEYGLRLSIYNPDALPPGTAVHLVSLRADSHIVVDRLDSTIITVSGLGDNMAGRIKTVTTSPGRWPIVNLPWTYVRDCTYEPTPVRTRFGSTYRWTDDYELTFLTFDSVSRAEIEELLRPLDVSILSDGGTIHWLSAGSEEDFAQANYLLALNQGVSTTEGVSDPKLTDINASNFKPVLQATVDVDSVCELLDTFTQQYPDLEPIWTSVTENGDASVLIGYHEPIYEIDAAMTWLTQQSGVHSVEDLRPPPFVFLTNLSSSDNIPDATAQRPPNQGEPDARCSVQSHPSHLASRFK
jgi:hypothetical protein